MPHEHKKQGNCERLTFVSVAHWGKILLPGESQELYLLSLLGVPTKRSRAPMGGFAEKYRSAPGWLVTQKEFRGHDKCSIVST
jgi:hypothetical protein